MRERRWLLLGLLGGLLLARPAGGDELTAEERQKLEQQAKDLNKEAAGQYQAGRYTDATKKCQEALEILQQLYPAERYPQGHVGLASTLNNLGTMLMAKGEYVKALAYYEQALAMKQKLYSADRFPQGHPDLASSLYSFGVLMYSQGDHAKALSFCEQALAMWQRVYPAERFPQGHPKLAAILNSLGVLLQTQAECGKALAYYEQALAMRRKLYPADKYPEGHPDLAESLNNLGTLMQAEGEYAKALPYYEQALAMKQKLYSADRFPQGHPNLATGLGNLGSLLESQGEYAKALQYHEQSLAMRQKLYSADKYPHGHPDLATSLNNLGLLLHSQREYGKALPYFEQALAMNQRLYPDDKYPQGHPDLATSLSNLGSLSTDQREYRKAVRYHEQALSMRWKLYSTNKYPQGHPDLAQSLNNLGSLMKDEGEYAKSLSYFQQALEMQQKLYPADKYRQGHPNLATNLNGLSALLLAEGNYAQAAEYAGRALRIYQDQLRLLASTASEAELLNLAAKFPGPDGLFLSTSRLGNIEVPTTYDRLWRSKGSVARIIEARHQLLSPGKDPRVTQLRDVRRRLADLLLRPAGSVKDQADQITQLTRTKEQMERDLAGTVPALRRLEELELLGPADLARLLPPGTAFIDLFRYRHREKAPDNGHWCYAVFIVRPGEPVVRLDLDRANEIDRALTTWRDEIQHGLDRASDAARTLRLLLWEPLTAHLPARMEAVWIAPDGPLSFLPWAALPGRKAGTVLLEEHAVAVVPHGPALLERLQPGPAERPVGRGLLAVGGVAYDEAPAVPTELALRAAPQGTKKLIWRPLPGSEREVEQILAIAQAAKQPALPPLRGTDAGPQQFLQQLPQARWAHLATHGFFAGPEFRSVLQVDPDDFRFGRERAAPGARNPLVLSGLVLAGANRPGVEGERGIVTAEALASLDLRGLELLVLSACETGLGQLAGGGEGVYGLQRALHAAGAKDIIASLWQVEDTATAALMGLFYRKLWIDGKPPLTALREAQLYLYHHPEQIAALGQKRGLDFANERELPADAVRPAAPVLSTGKRATIDRWAAFSLSGVGR